jgi:hypothetical protein
MHTLLIQQNDEPERLQKASCVLKNRVVVLAVGYRIISGINCKG